VQAWRLAQLLLMEDEALDRGRFVVLDLETGSLDVNRTEIIEVAAVRVENGRVSDDMLTSLVRPSHPRSLTHDASELTGIRWSDVRTAPEPHEIVPALLAFLGDDTIAGHNLLDFDLPVLSRYARRFLGPVENPVLDTRMLAARLFPDAPHDLHSLARQFPMIPRPTHRARADAITTAHLLLRLLNELRRDREVDALSELLPLVALGMYDQGVPDRDEFAQVFDAAIRAGNSAAARSAVALLSGVAPERQLEQALSWLRSRPEPPDPDQERWQRLRRGWQDVLDRFRASTDDRSLASLLIYARLATALDTASESDGRVTLMSLHAAKGREWPLVFLIGLEEGVLPSWHATDDDALKEARRCFYVGMTRAKRQLVITWSAQALGRPRAASRFLSFLPEDVVEHRDYSANA
jgi:DNA helicase-2/ATP-dependent DNA helicase PcrA